MAQQQPPPAGYRSLASAMGQSPQFAIFKRFRTLNAQNLLYLQAELTILENKLQQYIKEDQSATGIGDRDIYDRDWETLKGSCYTNHPSPGNDNRQWTTFLEIRAKLKEYNDALLKQNELLKLENPNPRDLIMLRQWMNSTERGNISLIGPDSDIWNEEDLDHVTLRLSKEKDPLFRSLSNGVIQWYHLHMGHRFRGAGAGASKGQPNIVGVATYSDEGIARFTRAISTFVACILPVASVVVLHVVDGPGRRLGILAGLVAAFSICMLRFTTADATNIFAATAAFTAVLVVYVGSVDDTGSNSSSTLVNLNGPGFLYNCTSPFSNCTAIPRR